MPNLIGSDSGWSASFPAKCCNASEMMSQRKTSSATC